MSVTDRYIYSVTATAILLVFYTSQHSESYTNTVARCSWSKMYDCMRCETVRLCNATGVCKIFCRIYVRAQYDLGMIHPMCAPCNGQLSQAQCNNQIEVSKDSRIDSSFGANDECLRKKCHLYSNRDSRREDSTCYKNILFDCN